MIVLNCYIKISAFLAYLGIFIHLFIILNNIPQNPVFEDNCENRAKMNLCLRNIPNICEKYMKAGCLEKIEFDQKTGVP